MKDIRDVPLPRQEIARREGLHAVYAFPIFAFRDREDVAASAIGSPSRATGVVGVAELYSEHAETPDESMLNVATSIGFQVGVFLEGRRAQDAERAHRVRSAAVVETALDCIITIDHEGRIVEWNPAAEGTFGRLRASVLGQQLAETIILPQYRDAHYKGFARYLQTGEAHVLGRRIEVEGMRADGSCFPCELAITRVPLAGTPMFTAYLRDLTDRRRLEARQRLLLRASTALLSYVETDRMLCDLSEVVVPVFADWYTVDVPQSYFLQLITSTPADGPGEFGNVLNPHITLYDPSGALVAGLRLGRGRLSDVGEQVEVRAAVGAQRHRHHVARVVEI